MIYLGVGFSSAGKISYDKFDNGKGNRDYKIDNLVINFEEIEIIFDKYTVLSLEVNMKYLKFQPTIINIYKHKDDILKQ